MAYHKDDLTALIEKKYDKTERLLPAVLRDKVKDLLDSRDTIDRRSIVETLQNVYSSVTKGQIDPLRVEKAVNVLFKEISLSLVCGDRIEIRRFGTMSVKKRKGGIARNPRTSQSIYVEGRRFALFRPSKEMIKEINSININDNDKTNKE